MLNKTDTVSIYSLQLKTKQKQKQKPPNLGIPGSKDIAQTFPVGMSNPRKLEIKYDSLKIQSCLNLFMLFLKVLYVWVFCLDR